MKVKLKKSVKPVVKQVVKSTKAVMVRIASAVFCLSGHRGNLFRLCEYGTDAQGVLHIRATQERDPKTGVFKAIKNAPWGEVIGGCLTGDAVAKLQLGAYINGGAKCNTAEVRQVSSKELASLKRGQVQFTQHDVGYDCHYLGDPTKRVVLGIVLNQKGQTYYWQAECDSNVHNKHERTKVTPAKAK